jgi:hypothetical protein
VAFGIEPDGGIDLIRHAVAGAPIDPSTSAPGEASTPAPGDASSPDAGDAPSGWQYRLGELDVTSFAVEMTDARVADGFSGGIESMDLRIRDLSSAADARFPTEVDLQLLTGGRVDGNGTVGLNPPSMDLAINVGELALPPAQPYVRQRAALEIGDGRLRFAGRLSYAADTSLRINGSGAVQAFSARDLLRGETFLAWETAGIENLDVDLGRSIVALEVLRLDDPFLELAIVEGGRTNLGDIFAGGTGELEAESEGDGEGEPGQNPPTGAAARPAPAIRIGRIDIANGTANFADRTLPVPFATGIYNLAGSISDTDTASDAPSRLSLQGRVGETGEFLANGSLKLLAPTQALDIEAEFRNLDLPLLTPYSTKFAGYEIAQGRLSLALDYALAGENLQGDNNIVVEQLELGAEVESPTAIDLPIRLAIGLLTDASGRIDLDLPVSGSIDDPQFSLGAMFGSVLGGVVRDAVTSPFRFLGGLIGADDPAELANLDFAAGSAELGPPEREKLMRLAEALRQRPLLMVAIRGQYATGPDGRALRETAVDSRVQALRDAATDSAAVPARVAVLETLYLETFPPASLDARRAEHTSPARPATGEIVAVPAQLDETALANALREDLIEAFELPADALAGLARGRAQAAADFLTGEAGLPPESTSILDPAETDDGVARIPLVLELATADDIRPE